MTFRKSQGPDSSWRAVATLALVVLALSGSFPVSAAQLDAVWIGGSAPWNNAGNWSPAAIPNNNMTNTFNALIDDGDAGTMSVVNVNLNATIDNLTLDAGDTLIIDNTRALSVIGAPGAGSILNGGLVRLESTGLLTNLFAVSGAVTISGGGTIQLSNNINNRIVGSSGGSFINLDNTILGAGQIGGGATDFSNSAAIQADQPAGIIIDPAANPFVNSGILRAANGATLRLQTGSFANDGGLIEALAASFVELSSATISGGTISTTGTGVIRTAVSTSNLLAHGATPVTNVGEIEIANGANIRLTGTTFQNQGSISILSTGFSTDLRADSTTVNLVGGGEVILGDHPSNRITGTGGGSLVNVDNTIRGAGQIGANTLDMTNQATIVANGINPLSLDPATQFNNEGSLLAQNATLRLINGFFDNTGGLIEAQSNGIVDVSTATVSGGTLSASGNGYARVVTSSGLNGDVDPVALACPINVMNGFDLTLRGSIQNSGSINLLSTGSSTDIQADGVVTLSGGGFINMSNSTAARIIGLAGGSLVNVDNTIRGSGAIGAGILNMTNQGLVLADQPTALVIDPANDPFINSGTLRASNGGTLSLTNGSCDNTGGLIEAENGSLVTLSAAVVSGGELTTSGTGLIRVINSATFDGTTNIPTNTGLIEFQNDADVVFLGAFNNTGTTHLASTATVTDFELHNGPVTLTGGGQITMSNVATNRIFAVNGGSLINVDNTISGSGNIGLVLTPITNQGTILANQSVALAIAPDAAIGLINSGTLRSTNAATMTIAAGPFTTSGSVIVDSGATISRTGAFAQTAGATIVNGSLTATGPIQIQGGTLSGNGTVTGNVTTSSITAPGTSAGQLNISGTYTQQSSGILAIEIAGPTPGSQHDVLAVGGTANLDGTISIDFINGFSPMIGQTFTVMTFPSRTGTFATVDVPCPAGFGVAVNVFATSVQVQIVTPTTGLGDMNCDCAVSHDDVTPFALALLDAPAYAALHPLCAVANADINQDSLTDAADIAGFIDLLMP